MSVPNFTWVPDGQVGTVTLEFTRGLQRFEGYVQVKSSSQFTDGGKLVTVVDDSWHEYLLEYSGFGPEVDGPQFARLTAWWSHVSRGGLFDFSFDGDQTFEGTTNAAGSVGDSTVTLVSTTGLADGDWIYLEDADDPTLHERKQIAKVDSATVITLTSDLDNELVTASPVRHAEHFPDCASLDSSPGFSQRPAGRGNYWDFRTRFRTTR